MVVDAPNGGLSSKDAADGRLKIILGVDYGTTFTGKSPRLGQEPHQSPKRQYTV